MGGTPGALGATIGAGTGGACGEGGWAGLAPGIETGGAGGGGTAGSVGGAMCSAGGTEGAAGAGRVGCRCDASGFSGVSQPSNHSGIAPVCGGAFSNVVAPGVYKSRPTHNRRSSSHSGAS